MPPAREPKFTRWQNQTTNDIRVTKLVANFLQPVWLSCAVVVYERYDLAMRGIKPAVARLSKAAPCTIFHPHDAAPCIVPEHLRSSISRAIIHDNDFEITACLLLKTFKAAL